MILSLQDERTALYFPRGFRGFLTALAARAGILPTWLGILLLPLPQFAEERKHGRMRRAVMEIEDSLEDLLAYSGPQN